MIQTKLICTAPFEVSYGCLSDELHYLLLFVEMVAGVI